MSAMEPERPAVDFVVTIRRAGGSTVDLPGEVLQDVYDIAINSMDFGSGFLGTEEVGNLRALGKAIGAERFDYQHDECLRCGHEYQGHRIDDSCYQEGCACPSFVSPIQ